MSDNVPFHSINKHLVWDLSHCALSAVRGFRNGIITGARIRLPYVFQAIIYAVIFRQGGYDSVRKSYLPFSVIERVSFVIKQMFIHGKNLGLFVLFYKSICCILRNSGVDGGIESWIAGLIGGYWAFGDNKGISGSVNNQIVLYLFARGIQGIIITGVKKKILPESCDISSPQGFRYLAAFSLALILYLTEYHPKSLNTGFMKTMEYLYHESDVPHPKQTGGISNLFSLVSQEEAKFLPFLILGTISLLFPLNSKFGLEQMLNRLLR